MGLREKLEASLTGEGCPWGAVCLTVRLREEAADQVRNRRGGGAPCRRGCRCRRRPGAGKELGSERAERGWRARGEWAVSAGGRATRRQAQGCVFAQAGRSPGRGQEHEAVGWRF